MVIRNKRHCLQLVLAAVVVLATTTACGGSDGTNTTVTDDCKPKYEFSTIDEGKLTIVTYDGPPYYHGMGASAEGIDKDILDEFAKESCLAPVWKVISPAAVIESVSQGRADVAAGGWWATPERADVVNQTKTPYLDGVCFAGKDEISNIDELKGKTIGTITAYAWVEDAQAALGKDNVKLYQNTDAVLDEIANGRVDAGLVGCIDAPYQVQERDLGLEVRVMEPDPAITISVHPSTPNYPHTKGNQEMTDALNAFIDAKHSDGFVAQTLEKFGVDPDIANIQE